MTIRATSLCVAFLALGLGLRAQGPDLPDYDDTPTRSYSVSPSGSDSNNGLSAPFRTITRGVQALKPGESLDVYPGTYTESIFRSIPSGSGWWAPTILRAKDPSRPPLVRAPSGSHFALQFSGTQHHIVVDGLIFEGGISAVCKITEAAKSIYLRNSEFRKSTLNGIFVTDARSTGHFFYNLKVHHNGRVSSTNGRFDHGMYISTSGNVVDSCDVYANSGHGIHIYNGSVKMSGNVVRNCETHENGFAPGAYGSGIGLYSGPYHGAYNNLTWGNGGCGITLKYGATYAEVFDNRCSENEVCGILIGPDTIGIKAYDNILSGNGYYGIQVYSGAKSADLRNNVLYSNSPGNLANSSSSTKLSGNSVGSLSSLEPELIDASDVPPDLDIELESSDAGADLQQDDAQ